MLILMDMFSCYFLFFFFFFNDTATTETYTLSLHDALPISPIPRRRRDRLQGRPARRPVRHQEPECDDDLRLRVELLGLNERLTFANEPPSGGFLLRVRR